MKSKRFVKSISISNESHDRVLFEGDLGELMDLSLVEGDVLEFIGVNGVLRVDLTLDQLKKIISKASLIEPSVELGR
jgi:hypothetical protein